MSFGFGASQAASAFGASQPASAFGASQPASAFGASQPTSAFGSSQPSLFASSAAPSAFGFGGASQAQGQNSLFGAPSQPSLFGSTPQSAPSLFGSAPQSQSLFGQPQSSTSLFGQPQSSASLFGQPQSAPSLFTNPQPQQSLWNSTPAPNPPQLPRAVTDVIERLNPMHPESKFHAALYNIVTSDISRYTRPPNMDEKLWDTAVAKNPDPSRLVPVQANLFDDLLVRSDMQERRLKEHLSVMGRIEKELAQIEDNVETDVRTKLAAYRRRHRELARKLLRIASQVELASSRIDSSVLSHSEMDRKRRLDHLARSLAAPADFKDKLSDLVELAESTILDRRVHPSVEIRDPRAASAVKSLLTDQLAGIQHLENVCERSDRDLSIMADGLSDR